MQPGNAALQELGHGLFALPHLLRDLGQRECFPVMQLHGRALALSQLLQIQGQALELLGTAGPLAGRRLIRRQPSLQTCGGFFQSGLQRPLTGDV